MIHTNQTKRLKFRFLRRLQNLTKSSPQINDEDFVNFCGLLIKHELLRKLPLTGGGGNVLR